MSVTMFKLIKYFVILSLISFNFFIVFCSTKVTKYEIDDSLFKIYPKLNARFRHNTFKYDHPVAKLFSDYSGMLTNFRSINKLVSEGGKHATEVVREHRELQRNLTQTLNNYRSTFEEYLNNKYVVYEADQVSGARASHYIMHTKAYYTIDHGTKCSPASETVLKMTETHISDFCLSSVRYNTTDCDLPEECSLDFVKKDKDVTSCTGTLDTRSKFVRISNFNDLRNGSFTFCFDNHIKSYSSEILNFKKNFNVTSIDENYTLFTTYDDYMSRSSFIDLLNNKFDYYSHKLIMPNYFICDDDLHDSLDTLININVFKSQTFYCNKFINFNLTHDICLDYLTDPFYCPLSVTFRSVFSVHFKVKIRESNTYWYYLRKTVLYLFHMSTIDKEMIQSALAVIYEPIIDYAFDRFNQTMHNLFYHDNRLIATYDARYKRSDEFHQPVSTGNWLSDAFALLISPVLNGVKNLVLSIWHMLEPLFIELFKVVLDVIVSFLFEIVVLIEKFVEVLAPQVDKLADSLMKLISLLVKVIYHIIVKLDTDYHFIEILIVYCFILRITGSHFTSSFIIVVLIFIFGLQRRFDSPLLYITNLYENFSDLDKAEHEVILKKRYAFEKEKHCSNFISFIYSPLEYSENC